MRAIDLNCDLGEGGGHEAELMPWITSANLATGAYAGDEATLRETAILARRYGVAIGAHPGFADREHFGRRELRLPVAEIGRLVAGQIAVVQALAPLHHVKPHGGLYNLAARERAVADAVAQAVRVGAPTAILYGLAGSHLLAAGRAAGLRVASEAFADRGYAADGSLLPRGTPGALLDPEAASAQALDLVREGGVRAADGTWLSIAADTICVHGDGARAVELVGRLRAAFKSAGVKLRAFSG